MRKTMGVTTLAYDLHLLVRRMDREADQLLAAIGTTYSRYLALLVTGENPGLTQRDLSGAVGTSEAATSRAVASLVAEGLVVSAPVPGGGNRRALRLTESGRSLVERASELLGSSFDDVARSVGIDPATLADDIRRLSSALTEESP